LRRRRVHQGRLRQADECSRRRVADRQRDQQRPEAERDGVERGRDREADAAGDEQRAAAVGVARDPDDRVEQAADDPGDRKRKPDLPVAEVEVVPDQRPRGRA
jgi:hypothetical protein